MSEILYPSCSELLTQLNVTKIEEIREVVAEAERITGWKLGAVYERRYMLESSGVYQDRTLFIPVESSTLWINEDYRYGKRLETTTPTPKCWNFHCLVLSQMRERTERDGYYWGILENCLRVHINPYRGDKGLVFQTQGDDSSGDFPALAEVTRRFGNSTNWFSNDGGSSFPFNHWCIKNGFEDIAHDKYDSDCVEDRETCWCAPKPINLQTKLEVKEEEKEEPEPVKVSRTGLRLPKDEEWKEIGE